MITCSSLPFNFQLCCIHTLSSEQSRLGFSVSGITLSSWSRLWAGCQFRSCCYPPTLCGQRGVRMI
ncbi:hypothetical protein I7I48_05493 [Histoplasma ohiense]|nr:hypothetical protein I7I48_05493 [Histoplasma ohiense (nom. inval.)]